MKKIFLNTIDSNEKDEYLILDADDIKKCNLCDCYASYGIQVGCHDAGCYSMDNSGISFKADLNKYISEKFNIEFDYDEDLEESSEEVKAAVEDFIKTETSHVEVTALTYWDGHNHNSIIFNGGDFCKWEEQENIQILDDCSRVGEGIIDHYKLLRNTESGEEFEVSTTRFAGPPIFS